MGSRGPVAKHPDKAAGHRKRALTVLSGAGEKVEKPRPPSKILARTRRDWDAFWESPIATSVEKADWPVVIRLFRLRDQWARSMDVVRETMMVKGSTGQVRVNPLADYASKLEASILRLETELGLTPMARARLGITITDAVESLDRMNARFSEADDADSDDDVGDADPRLASLQLTDQNR